MKNPNLVLIQLGMLILFLFSSCGISKDLYNESVNKISSLSEENKNLKSEITDLNEKIKVMKAKCNIQEALYEFKADGFLIEILEVNGDKVQQVVNFKMNIINLEANRKFGFGGLGNNIQINGKNYNLCAGTGGKIVCGALIQYSEALTNTPLLGEAQVKEILPTTELINLLKLKYFVNKDNGVKKYATFRNLKINWK